MYKCSLWIHQIKFLINSRENLSNGSSICNHTSSSHDPSKITSWDNSWRLRINSNFEPSWAPVNKLNGSPGFYGGNSSIDIFGDDIPSVHYRASHILTVPWVAFSHHILLFKWLVCDLSNWKLFMIIFFRRNNWWVRGQCEVNSWIWNQVCLQSS